MPWKWLVLAAALAGGWHWWTLERPVPRAAGAVAPAPPQQVDLDPPDRFERNGFRFAGRARYEIVARVLRKEIYRFDGAAALAPVDLALGWGRMSDSAVLEQLAITQMGRFFYWRPRDPRTFAVPADALVTEVGQVHAIPSDPAIEQRLRRLRPGELVVMRGYLVDVDGPAGFTWRTSLTRSDTGDGACEIMWIESLDVR
ncbi:MAG: hypothetical protein ABIS17_07470 [Casimicrobiaceae bacterium]